MTATSSELSESNKQTTKVAPADVAVGHAAETRLDRVDGELRRDQLGHVRFGEIERHERLV